MMWKMVKQFQLNACLCFLDSTEQAVDEDVTAYNQKVKAATDWLQQQKETFIIKEEEQNKASYVLVEKGIFYGMGVYKTNITNARVEDLKPYLTQYPENEIIRSMISSFVEKVPAQSAACVAV